MGRYYGGDIAGKFWFGVQSSDDAKHFGIEPAKQEKVYSMCMQETIKPLGHACTSCNKEDECEVILKNEIWFHFTNNHVTQVHAVLEELESQLLKKAPSFASVLQKLEEDTEWKEDAYNDNVWISEEIDSAVAQVSQSFTNNNEEDEFNKLAARYLLGVQIYRCLFVKESCSFWCEL